MKKITTYVVAFLLIIGFIVMFPWWATTVLTYEEGVEINWGKVDESSSGAGLNFYNPMRTDIIKVDMRERTTTVKTQTISKEGLQFGIDITVIYRVKNGQAIYLVNNLQTQLSEYIRSRTNATIDDIATGKDKNELYSDEGRVEVVTLVKAKLNEEIGQYADIVQVIFEDIDLPLKLKEAIERQQAALELVKEKESLKAVAQKDADIKRIEARGIADANNIIQRSLTKAYLQYEAIQKLNPTAEKVFIPANGVLPTIELNN